MEEKFTLCMLEEAMLDESVDVYIDTFTKEPWNDVYESREQVVTFFKNHMKNNYFLGYVLLHEKELVALSIGMIKPWIKGREYYIDQFCVKDSWQGKGIGTIFLNEIEKDIERNDLNAIMLNTDKGFPSEKFYVKNGFIPLEDTILLVK